MLLRRQVVAVLAFPLIACSGPTVSDRGVEVTLTVDRTAFRLGDTARVAVVVVNRGTRSVTLSGGGCPPAFTVLESDGTAAIPGPQMCSAVAVSRALPSGATYVFRFDWALDANGSPLGLGAYRLQGRVVGPYLRAESAAVEIRVQAPAAADQHVACRLGADLRAAAT